MPAKSTKAKPRIRKTKTAPSKVAPPPKEWPPDPKRVQKISRRLTRDYQAYCALTHQTPWQLLQSTILSAQCTDKRVNMVTPELFKRWPTPDKLAKCDASELEEVIRSTGFYRNKAKNLIGAGRTVTESFKGEVPKTMEELLTIPGVARKTANVVLGTAFGKNEGFVVDTHIHRISKRLGLTQHDDPVRIERDLMEVFPRARWSDLGHQIIWHGRKVCTARKPQCDECPLLNVCPSAFQVGQ